MNCMQWLSCVHIITITRHGNLTGEPLWPRRLSIEIQQAYVLISIYIYIHICWVRCCALDVTPPDVHSCISIKQEYRWHVPARIRSRFECTTLAFMYIYVYIYIYICVYIYIYIYTFQLPSSSSLSTPPQHAGSICIGVMSIYTKIRASCMFAIVVQAPPTKHFTQHRASVLRNLF
jgi:hypothetical protein